MRTNWTKVETALFTAKGIAWDGCHKIYVLMDDAQMEEMEGLEYNPLLPVIDPAEALAVVQEWYEESCGLRFVSAVKTVAGDPNDGFQHLIAQFEDEEE